VGGEKDSFITYSQPRFNQTNVNLLLASASEQESKSGSRDGML
jgi:hypothetical protein